MRDVHQVLREKELEVARVRQEIEALRSIIPLLADEDEDEDEVTSATPPLYSPLRAINRE